MKGNGWALLLAVVLAARGVGLLPRGREMEELTLVSALAADRAGAAVAVTAVTGVRASQDEEPQVLTGKGQSLAEACRGLGKRAVPSLIWGRLTAFWWGRTWPARDCGRPWTLC